MELQDLPGQLDTAADRSVLPLTAVGELELPQVRELLVTGVGGQILTLPTFLVQLELRQLPPRTVEVLASPDEPFVLLGRDVLNAFQILLNGPQQFLQIE
jgi:hypothetical protein